MNSIDHTSHLSIALPKSDRDFILLAVNVSRAASISAFLREAALDRARSVLGDTVTPPVSPPPQAKDPTGLVYGYVTDGEPANAAGPRVTFPSIRSFGTNLSDRNREILRWIATHKAGSIHDLSRRFDYPYANLTHNLRKLHGLGLIGYREVGRQALSPFLQCGRLRLLLPFRVEPDAQRRMLKVAVKATGEEIAPPDADLMFGSMNEFAAAVPDRGYALLRLIAEHEPETISALALLTGTTVSNTYPLIQQFTELGLVATVKDGQRKRPSLVYDGIELELVFA
jgi:predicted transcriptional regulator